MRLTVTVEGYNDLTPEEQEQASNNGAGKQCATYLRLAHFGKTILLESDAMEPEDVRFSRDLSWVREALLKCYELGLADAGR